MPEWGYREGGHGQMSRHGEIQSMGIQFQSLNHRGLEVQLSFQSVPPSRTHLLYVATAETLPPRPPESYLPTDVKDVEIIYGFPFSGSPRTQEVSQFLVRDEGTVRELVREINALTNVSAGMSSGGLHRWESVTLIFRTRGAREIPAELRFGRVVIVGESRPLRDQHARVQALATWLAEGRRRRADSP